MDTEAESIEVAGDEVCCLPMLSRDVSDLLTVCGCRNRTCTWAQTPPHLHPAGIPICLEMLVPRKNTSLLPILCRDGQTRTSNLPVVPNADAGC